VRAIFIRHGESTGNLDIPASDHSQIGLTERGHAQAVTVAETWKDRPALIALSPFIRTRLTAAPTILRFPDVPVEILPMQEFTYLEPSRWIGSSHSQRLPHIDAYWKAAEPDYCDGPGAESFSNLLARVAATLARLQQLNPDALVFAFTHGQFMQALRMSLLFPDWDNKQKMEYFRLFDQENPVQHVGLIEITQTHQGRWLLSTSAPVCTSLRSRLSP
jgi:broad specificity phosphatase PhoE